ncbi:hypothetical protein BK126_02930 [Paenibacillus sp. FSL H7-0326]|uniref:hypothetical protein n=1 Tax=Paenibacillus sp. FSL H7-0326 TaxID=1921144 RepID=UPI00096FBF70|nr:hypothetical protein [Paenibacillus sp. FSL H7-0326]OMC71081.1 hypothetical protein BK126_02930 [Paenibacillus sp. FSL H7-0326]
MKKFVYMASGMLLGIALALPLGSAFADQIKSVVGTKITGQYSVTVNGKELADPAIVAEGKSYAPVRSLVSAVGTGEIIVDNTEKTIDITVETENDQPVSEPEVTTPEETPEATTNPYTYMTEEKLLSTKELFEVVHLQRIDSKLAEYNQMLANPESWLDVENIKGIVSTLEKQKVDYTEKLRLVNEAIAALEE